MHCQHLPLNIASMNPAGLLCIFSLEPSSKYFLIYYDLLLTNVAPGGFPCGSDGKESACNAENPGSIPGS